MLFTIAILSTLAGFFLGVFVAKFTEAAILCEEPKVEAPLNRERSVNAKTALGRCK